MAIGLFSFSISSSICSKALLQKEIGCRCVLFLSLPLPLCFWKRLILEIKILSTSDFNKLAEYLCVPVNQCLEHINIEHAWFHFNTSSLGSRKLTNTFGEGNSNLQEKQNYLVPAKSEWEMFFIQDLSVKTKVSITEIVQWQKQNLLSNQGEKKNFISF